MPFLKEKTMSVELQEKPKTEKVKSGQLNDFFARMGVMGELLRFFWRRKLYWLVPMIIALIVIGILIATSAAGGAGLFIYTLF
jgi:hypothetical protein